MARIAELARLVLKARRIAASDLPDPMREEVARSAIRIDVPRWKALPNPIRLMGFEIRYGRADQLRYLFREIFVEGSYLFRASGSRPLVLDCGSNIGLSILFFKTLHPDARIIGFEPDPATFELLTANIERNGLSEVRLHRCALDAEDGTVDFYRSDREPLMMSLHPERLAGEKITVPARRLSSFITEEVELLKLDIEGAEDGVMRDLAASGKLALIRQIHMEYHHHISPRTDKLSAMLALLEENGFGYQLSARSSLWPAAERFQDISIYGYRKRDL